jgi:outer membrane protein W
MGKKFLFFYVCVFVVSVSSAQLTKGNWLVGGAASFYSTKYTYSSGTTSFSSNDLKITATPSIGYFLSDKFSTGLRLSYTKTKSIATTPSGGNTNENRLNFGPFARYYFLKTNKSFNLLTDVGYQYGLYWFTPTTGNRSMFSASVGTVVFFNSSVGLEFLVGYYSQREAIKSALEYKNEDKGLQMSIGLQFHLEK